MEPASKSAGSRGRAVPPRGFTIRQKLLALIVLLVAGVVALLAVYLPAGQLAAMRASLEAKSVAYARLASKQLEPAVAFDDRETAREVFDSVAQDPEVDSLCLLNARGEVLAERGSLHTRIAGVRAAPSAPVLVRSNDHVTAVAEVASLEGPRGTVVIELSIARLASEQRNVRKNALLAGLLALVIGIGGASLIATSLSRRLGGIARFADAVAAGNLDQPALEADSARDEISTVAVAFNTMLGKIRSLIGELQRAAEEEQRRLERLVLERTEELHERNADLKRVLENVGQGFLTVDLTGRMSRERSAVLERWLGPAPQSGLFADALGQASPALGDWFAAGWEELQGGVMPPEVSLDQLPKRATVGEVELELAYRPIVRADGELDRVLVVVSDITARLLSEQAEAHERELTTLFVRAISDRAGLLDFLAESSAQVEYIVAKSAVGVDAVLKRALHTLKGNAAIYGVETVASLCHRLEDDLAESGKLEPSDIAALQSRWHALQAKLHPLVATRTQKLAIEPAELQAIVALLEAGGPRAGAISALRRLRLEPSELPLGRLSEQASALAAQLDKPVAISVDAGDVRLKADEWSAFWNASIHVLRNSLDHGLELAEERTHAGKPATGSIRLRTWLNREHFTIEFADDGRGIDWTAVEGQARQLGLAMGDRKALVDALFTDGLSTRAGVTEFSGRGVGLGAVREACRALGGAVEIDSERGVGTTFRFVWPARVVTRHLGSAAASTVRASQPPPERLAQGS